MYTFKINRACFYRLSGLDFIGYFYKSSRIRALHVDTIFTGRTDPHYAQRVFLFR